MQIPDWPPDKCEMPNLSELNSKLILNLMVRRIIGKYNLTDPKTYLLVVSYIRLVDKLVDDYQRTRNTQIEFVTTPGNVVSPLIFATNHCESLLTTMLRVIRFGQRIRRDPNGPPIAKRIQALSGEVWMRVNNMRCAIEHLDEQIITNTWSPNEPPQLLLKNDCLTLNGEEIFYSELADWVKQLHAVGIDLSTHEVV
ncbi:MAG: hypothetical protein WC762_02500 [Methylobacter sp.]|jgi:hypothetical protein